MFAIRLRVSPCSARCSPRSVDRDTRTSPSSCSTPIWRDTRSSSSPLGPFTFTSSGSIVISTPSGTAIGCLPMRDIVTRCSLPVQCARGGAKDEQSKDAGPKPCFLQGEGRGRSSAKSFASSAGVLGGEGASLPDPRYELAAHALAARVVAGHHAPGGGDDHGSHAALDLGHIGRGDVLAPARLRQALNAEDDRLAVVGVLQLDPQRAADPGGLDLVAVDVALLGEDARQLGLEGRSRHRDLVVVGAQSVADAGEEIGDWIGLHWLPAGLGEPRDHALVGDLPETDAAEAELAQIRARATAPLAPVVVARLVLGPALLADPL